jgi:hypothetical protein
LFTSNVRIIKPLSVAMATMILISVLLMIIQTTLQNVYAVEKIDTIKVSPREIKITLPDGSKLSVYHLFIVYTQKQQHQQQEEPTDKAYVCQGFPLDPATGQIPLDSELPLFPSDSSFLLQGRCIPFDNDNRDWPYRNGPPQPITLEVSADDAKDVYRCFIGATNELNDAKATYALLGYNSNSYVRAILDKCDVPGGDSRIPVPPQLAPGWSLGASLINALNQNPFQMLK